MYKLGQTLNIITHIFFDICNTLNMKFQHIYKKYILLLPFCIYM